MMPRNGAGRPVRAADYNRSDGFSPGQTIVIRVPPALDPGRSRDRRPFYGIRRVPRLPWGGSALVVYDIGPPRDGLGTPPAPAANVPPEAGADPHGVTGLEPSATAQFSEFLKLDGALVDTCGGRPCYAAGWAGP
jgi:hypothetical protein